MANQDVVYIVRNQAHWRSSSQAHPRLHTDVQFLGGYHTSGSSCTGVGKTGMLSPRLCRVATGVLIIRRYGKRKVAHWKFPWKFSLVAHRQIGADYNRNETPVTPCKDQSRESADLARVKAFDAVPCQLVNNSFESCG
jgi:hypothetical protein